MVLFNQRETDTEKLSTSPKVTQLVSGTRICKTGKIISVLTVWSFIENIFMKALSKFERAIERIVLFFFKSELKCRRE